MPEDGADFFEREFTEYAETEYLFVWFFQPVKALVNGESGVFIKKQLFDVGWRGKRFRQGLFQRDCPMILTAIGIIAVPRDREQPRADILFAVEALQTVQCLEKGLLRQLLGQRFRMSQPL